MHDIDRAISRLGAIPVHPRLAMIEDDVLDMIRRRHKAARARQGMISATAMAMVFGILSGALPEFDASAALTANVVTPPPLAPSALLGTGL